MAKELVLNLKLKDFDGPLDVLSSMISENKMDILNLDVAMLAEQYLKFIQEHVHEISIEDASEYMVMATHLLVLKSKMILPIENTNLTDSNFEYERDKLVKRIIEYRKYKEAVPFLLKKLDKRMEMNAKSQSDLESYHTEQTEFDELPQSVDPKKLIEAMTKAFEKWKFSLFSKRKIIVQELSVEDVEKDILDFLDKNKTNETSFANFLQQVDELKISQQYIVTCFSALLELVKYGKINLIQNHFEDDLYFSINNQNDEMKDTINS